MKTGTGRMLRIVCTVSIFSVTIVGCANLTKNPGQEAQSPVLAKTEQRLQSVSDEPKQSQSQKIQSAKRYVHTVKWQGETLSYIAKWYTGNYENWRNLAEANPNLNPNRIYKGNQITIPDDVLMTRNPLPKNFLTQLAPISKTRKTPTKKKSSKSSPRTKEENPLPLFGPKVFSN